MKLTIYQIDAFTNKLFAGNPAAVCPLTEWLADDVMLKIAAENNLAETAFFVKRDDVFELRWFTPTTEVPLCGHATLASAFVIFNCLGVETETIQFVSPHSGNLSVARQNEMLILDFPSFQTKECDIPAGLIEALGATPQKTLKASSTWIISHFADENTISAMTPDMTALSKLSAREIIVTAPGKDSDFVVRMFAPKIGISEDPVTGGIQCALTPYWSRILGKQKLFARQISQRGGELFCELKGDRVKIGGNAVLYLKGEITI